MDIHLRNAMDRLLWARFGLDLRDDGDAVLRAAVDRAYNKRVPERALERVARGILEEAATPDEAATLRSRLVSDLVANECAGVKGFTEKSATGWLNRCVRNLSVLQRIYAAYGPNGSPCSDAGEYALSTCPMDERDAVGYLLEGMGSIGAPLRLDSPASDVLEAAINGAYKDAATRGSYVPNPEQRDESEAARQKAAREIARAVRRLCKNGAPFDEWHAQLCRTVRGIFGSIERKGGGKAFTYGNAQKWVNVSMRNLYILAAVYERYAPEGDFSEKIGRRILALARELHVPVDSYTLACALDCGVRLPRKDPGRADSKTNRLPWSVWDDEKDYVAFQKSLARALKGESPMEWETRAWIDARRDAERNARALAARRARKEAEAKE